MTKQNSDNSLRPIPTEYKGIVFRSKSEAIFARALDLSEKVNKWLYEPLRHYTMKIPSHDWDFLVYSKTSGTVLIEYKPSQPSETYIKNLSNKIDGFYKHLEMEVRVSHLIEKNLDFFKTYESLKEIVRGYPSKTIEDAIRTFIYTYNFCLVWGSPFSNDPCKNCCYSILPFRVHDYFVSLDIFKALGINNEIAQKAKSYRFDLIHLRRSHEDRSKIITVKKSV